MDSSELVEHEEALAPPGLSDSDSEDEDMADGRSKKPNHMRRRVAVREAAERLCKIEQENRRRHSSHAGFWVRDVPAAFSRV